LQNIYVPKTDKDNELDPCFKEGGGECHLDPGKSTDIATCFKSGGLYEWPREFSEALVFEVAFATTFFEASYTSTKELFSSILFSHSYAFDTQEERSSYEEDREASSNLPAARISTSL
jgi:hypothetical protein